MTEVANMTKKNLIVIARELGIVGRDAMSRETLAAAIIAAQIVSGEDATVHVYTKPYNQRNYAVVTKNEEAYAKLPKQAKAIFDFMASSQIKGIGKTIVAGAVEKGFLQTTQNGDVLYAFYARKLEDAGVRLVS